MIFAGTREGIVGLATPAREKAAADEASLQAAAAALRSPARALDWARHVGKNTHKEEVLDLPEGAGDAASVEALEAALPGAGPASLGMMGLAGGEAALQS